MLPNQQHQILTLQRHIDAALRPTGLLEARLYDRTPFGQSLSYRATRATCAYFLARGWSLNRMMQARHTSDIDKIESIYAQLSDHREYLAGDNLGMFFDCLAEINRDARLHSFAKQVFAVTV